jgi:lipid-A-disaccharide synthase-like uncharacterized protein
MTNRGSRSGLRWAVGFGIVGILVATLLVIWFYVAEKKESVYPVLYYFGWAAVHVNSVFLKGAEKTASTSHLHDGLYIVFTGLQWALVGIGAHLVFRRGKVE